MSKLASGRVEILGYISNIRWMKTQRSFVASSKAIRNVGLGSTVSLNYQLEI